MRMWAQHMPETPDDSWPAGMGMLVRVGVTRAARAQLRIAHDAQDVRRTSLQHIDNNHPDATANHSQMIMRYSPSPAHARPVPIRTLTHGGSRSFAEQPAALNPPLA